MSQNRHGVSRIDKKHYAIAKLLVTEKAVSGWTENVLYLVK